MLNYKGRQDFLKICSNNDSNPDYLKFRIPKNEVLLKQAVHSFQLKLLRKNESCGTGP